MRKQSWTKRDPIKNYFPLPNEIYDLGLSRGAISVYSFLLRREDRKTYQCLLSYREIGEGVGMCVTTVRKYVAELEERSLIRTERTTVTTKDGRKRNGRLLYHILPIQLAIDQYYERQMDIHQCLALTVSVQWSRVPFSAVSKIPSQEPDMLPFSMAKAQRRRGSQAVTVKFVV